MSRLPAERLTHLRTAAEVAIRMSSLQPHTVHVKPDELAALIDDNAELTTENAVLRRQLSELQKSLDDVRVTMVATKVRR